MQHVTRRIRDITARPLEPSHQYGTRQAYLWGVAIALGVTATVWLIQRLVYLPQLSITPIYLVGVLLCAVTAGRRPAVLCAALSFVAFKFFFVDPIYTLTIDDAGDVVRMLIFLATALVGGGMAVWLREQATAAQQRADQALALYELSQAVSAQLEVAAIAPLIVATTRRLLDSPACQLLLHTPDGRLEELASSGAWPPGARASTAAAGSPTARQA